MKLSSGFSHSGRPQSENKRKQKIFKKILAPWEKSKKKNPEKNNNKQLQQANNQQKTVEHEGEGDCTCSWCVWKSP